ncbi:hypothetical protein BH720_025050 [Desertifilum tharense IPPAS B-1220]|uniref:Uncharacterized protein n=1 Tax=Desertifilum tharense IPPAS B-1220 TaxID=1781255 RepID=A0A1E5QDR1_9CYAN|nr:hypothetical protein [Desertifilum tharense]OEJ72767.1 hypothetical protein BH720_22570 [Desertifilum tharense IPPAS B-1220]
MYPKKLWFIGLALITALAIGFWGRIPALTANPLGELSAQAQTPSPTPPVQTTPLPPPPPPPAAPLSPPPPSPSPSPSPTPQPTPEPTAADALLSTPPLDLGGNFEDSRGRFQVGILSGYKVGSAGRNPLFEAPDGNLAYTVVVRLRATEQPLTPNGLAQIAIETFQQGEGFQPGEISSAASGETIIPWTGQLTFGAQAQPMSGAIVASQPQRDVLLLLIATTEAGAEQLPSAIAALAPTLQ